MHFTDDDLKPAIAKPEPRHQYCLKKKHRHSPVLLRFYMIPDSGVRFRAEGVYLVRFAFCKPTKIFVQAHGYFFVSLKIKPTTKESPKIMSAAGLLIS